MFDTTIIRPDRGDHYHSHTVNVTEKRAPTDESAKILREYEEAADKRWIQLVRVADNSLNCVIYIDNRFWDFNSVVRAVFTLNGKKIVVDGDLPHHLTTQQERAEWAATKFVTLCAERIAIEALNPVLGKALNEKERI